MKSLNDSTTDLNNISENLVLPTDNLESTSKIREKRSLSFLASLLGSSSAAKAAASGSSSGSGTSSGGDAAAVCIFSLKLYGYFCKYVVQYQPNISLFINSRITSLFCVQKISCSAVKIPKILKRSIWNRYRSGSTFFNEKLTSARSIFLFQKVHIFYSLNTTSILH